MAELIGLPRAAWRRQPSGRVELNRASPLVVNLQGLYVFNESKKQLTNIVGGVDTNTFTGSPILAASRAGIGLHFNSSGTGQYLAHNPWSGMVSKTKGCIAVAGYPMTPYRGVYLFAMSYGITPTNRYYLRKNSTNVEFGWDTAPDAATGPTWGDQQYGTASLEWGGGTWSGIFNGRRVNTTAGTQAQSPNNAALCTVNAGSPGTASYHANFQFLWIGIWSAPLPSDDAHHELHVNPWQLFAPAPARFYLIPSSGGVGNYQLTSSLTSSSTTSSSALHVLRALQASLTSTSETATITLDTAALISLLSALASASSTSTSAAAIQRTLLTALTSASETPSAAVQVQRALSSAVTSTSETATITLSIAGLIALLTAISSTSNTSTPSASVQRALSSALSSSSSTASITLNTTTLIALLSAVASSSLTATSALNIARSLSSAINSQSSTPSIVLPVQRSLITSHTSQSSTSISALELVNLIALASAINSQSSTSTVTANLVRALVGNLLSASSTSAISVPVLREFASALVSASLTDSIDLALAMLGQVDLVSAIESRSLTNPQVRLLADLVAAIQTEMKLHMVGVAPSFTMTGSGPSIAVHRT